MYTAFASVYDRLMADVDYQKWAYFYHLLMVQRGIHQGNVCECACGTGSITMELQKLGYTMTGVDLSTDMLFEAGKKARKAAMGIPFIRQDMRMLNLHRPMEAVLATNDGLNYLKSTEDLIQFFKAAGRALKPGGMLAMDLSTPYKLKNVLGDHFIADESESIAYLWQNQYHEKNASVDMNLAIFVRQEGETYLRIGEHQVQYSHTKEEIEEALIQCGYCDILFFADKHMRSPAENELRWFISALKNENV